MSTACILIRIRNKNNRNEQRKHHTYNKFRVYLRNFWSGCNTSFMWSHKHPDSAFMWSHWCFNINKSNEHISFVTPTGICRWKTCGLRQSLYPASITLWIEDSVQYQYIIHLLPLTSEKNYFRCIIHSASTVIREPKISSIGFSKPPSNPPPPAAAFSYCSAPNCKTIHLNRVHQP